MSRFHDESYYDRHWDQFEDEEECDCYWLANGDENADVECGHCKTRRLDEERAAAERKDRTCAVISSYLERHGKARPGDEEADNFAQLFNYLIDQHEFLATQPFFRESVRAKALEYKDNAAVSFICGRMLDALDRLQIYPGYVLSRREEAEMLIVDSDVEMEADVVG
jgi:hypothetical protein